MMAKFTKVFLGALGVLAIQSFVQLPTRADDASTLLNAPKLPPYQWFASTDPKHQNADYVLLKPNETRRIVLGKGTILRLWSTASEPDKIELSLQNGTRIELLKNGKASSGNYYQKAYTFYLDASTPAAARDLKSGAALIVRNESKKENKWFYQATIYSFPLFVIDKSKNPLTPVAKLDVHLDWNNLYPTLKKPAQDGLKFLLRQNTITLYQLCVAAGSARSQKGKPIPILNVSGEGAFVGLVLDIRPAPDAHRRTFAFLEGNEILTADGRKYEGTGTEDFFNSAWYFPDKPFDRKYSGLVQKSTSPPSVTAYRWMIPDAVPFKKNFKFEFEHGNGNNDNDLEYRWVAFWYQKPPFKFEIGNELSSSASTPAVSASPSEDSNTAQRIVIFAALAGAILVGGWALWRRARR